MTHSRATSQSNAPSAAASPVPVIMQARASGSVRGRAALSQTAKRLGAWIVSDMGVFITESKG